MKKGQLKDAEAAFKALVDKDPTLADAHAGLVRCLLSTNRVEEADGAAKKALAALPSSAVVHAAVGDVAFRSGNFADAEKEYRAAIEASHGSALTWFNLALFFRHQQRWNDMEDAIQHAVSAQLDRPEIIMESGEVLLRSGRNVPAAVQYLRRYLALNSKVEEAPAFKAHYLLGTALEKQGDKQGAAQEYRAALSLAKNFSRAQEALDRLNR